MELKVNKFKLEREGDNYTVDMGSLSKNGDNSVIITFNGLKNAYNTLIEPKCGCTVSSQEIINKNTLQAEIKYKDCVGDFSKTVVVKPEGIDSFRIKLKGTCQ